MTVLVRGYLPASDTHVETRVAQTVAEIADHATDLVDRQLDIEFEFWPL